MVKGDAMGVQRLALQQYRCVVGRRYGSACQLGTAAVKAIAQDGATQMRQMDADLMRPTRFGKDAYRCESALPFQNFEKCLGGSARSVVIADRHLLTLVGMDSNRLFDPITISVGCGRSDRKILFADGSLLKLSSQSHVGGIRFCHQDDATGIAVQAMNDAGTRFAPRLG